MRHLRLQQRSLLLLLFHYLPTVETTALYMRSQNVMTIQSVPASRETLRQSTNRVRMFWLILYRQQIPTCSHSDGWERKTQRLRKLDPDRQRTSSRDQLEFIDECRDSVCMYWPVCSARGCCAPSAAGPWAGWSRWCRGCRSAVSAWGNSSVWSQWWRTLFLRTHLRKKTRRSFEHPATGSGRLKPTYDKSQQFVRQQAGGDEGHPQTDVQLLSQFRLDPHEQTTHTHTRTYETLTPVPRQSIPSVCSVTDSLLYFLQDVGHFTK